jgi:hypothetical protein
MRCAIASTLFSLLCGCAARGGLSSSAVKSSPPIPREEISAPIPEVKDPNFILIVSEVVPNPDDEGISYTKVIVDGKEVGKTVIGRRSQERTLKLKLPTGNQPIRLEHWILPGIGEWTHLDDALQPRERFVRIEEGTIARLELRFSAGASANTITLSRENSIH